MSAQLPQQRLTVPSDIDEESFYQVDGKETLVTHADLEEAVDNSEKPHLREKERYWVNKPYAFVVIYKNVKDNELRYVVVEPRVSKLEQELINFLRDKLKASLEYSEIDIDATPKERSRIVRDKTIELMNRYNYIGSTKEEVVDSLSDRFKDLFIDFVERQANRVAPNTSVQDEAPTPRDPATGEVTTLNPTQIRRILYYLVRDYIRFDRIDAIKQDVNVEEICCNGYNSYIFLYHSKYGEYIPTNVWFGERELDNYVKSLAQSAGKGISRRQPNVDATLVDGSRAQLTLGKETSEKGTNFTIRQFNEIPFTPVDLINWETYNIDQMAYLWLAMEQQKSVVFAGGTASGKTTTLNALSLFLPSTDRIVSIEDTRELEIPQSNWISRTTRQSFQKDGEGEINEYDLLEDALRQRPVFVIMGEVRGSEGQDLFQMMNTGHTTHTTFHANKPKEVIRRFTTDPINVSPSMFDALDIICMQENVNLEGSSVRRAKEIVEVGDYNQTKDQFSLNNAFRWERQSDEFRKEGESNIISKVQQENAWTEPEVKRELEYRKIVLSYLVKNNINTYAGVAATLQAYMSSPETILGLIADGELRKRIGSLHQMKTINIDTDPEKEALTPRPRTPDDVNDEASKTLSENEALLTNYNSNDIDFAQTISNLIGSNELDGDERDQLISTDAVGELPEGDEDVAITDSHELSATKGQSDELNLGGELDELFEEEESDVDDNQVILTSDNLDKLNATEEVSRSDIDELESTDEIDELKPSNENELNKLPSGDNENEDAVADIMEENSDEGENKQEITKDGDGEDEENTDNDDGEEVTGESSEDDNSDDGERDDSERIEDNKEVEENSEEFNYYRPVENDNDDIESNNADADAVDGENNTKQDERNIDADDEKTSIGSEPDDDVEVTEENINDGVGNESGNDDGEMSESKDESSDGLIDSIKNMFSGEKNTEKEALPKGDENE